jgi:hypothetical protein
MAAEDGKSLADEGFKVAEFQGFKVEQSAPRLA